MCFSNHLFDIELRPVVVGRVGGRCSVWLEEWILHVEYFHLQFGLVAICLGSSAFCFEALEPELQWALHAGAIMPTFGFVECG